MRWKNALPTYICGMRKIKADCLFPVSSAPIQEGMLLLSDDGEVVDVVGPGEEGYDLNTAEIHEGWLIPGMVNAHCHLELSHTLGAVPENTGLDGFVEQIMNVRASSDEVMQAAMQKADAEMRANGIVAVGDISNSDKSFATKAHSAIEYFTFIERFGLASSSANGAFESGMQLLELLQKLPRNTRGNLSPHAPYSVSKELLEKLCRHVEAVNGVLSIHNQETESEDVFFKTASGRMAQRMQNMGIKLDDFRASGKSSFQTLAPTFPKEQRIQLVHNTFSSADDISLAMATFPHLYWCLCPGANRYIENQLPPVQELRKQKATITLGTDSLASNHQLDLVKELFLLQDAHPDIPSSELIEWATINGATLLGMEKELGSFERGKRPGVVLLSAVDKFKGLILPVSRARLI